MNEILIFKTISYRHISYIQSIDYFNKKLCKHKKIGLTIR